MPFVDAMQAYGAMATVFGRVTTAWAGGDIVGTGITGRRISERRTARAAVLTALVVATALLAIAAIDNLSGFFVLTSLARAAEREFSVTRQTTLGPVIDHAGQGSAAAAQCVLLNTATVLALNERGPRRHAGTGPHRLRPRRSPTPAGPGGSMAGPNPPRCWHPMPSAA
ncbi:hypothetical protein ACIQAC_39215 [Streptomyces sp. NPDC088387]|uniref:hypothetical protein n=1 Tax=Streptomyces sp. NPDC088387 TaxID=3365859 RepID=UPI00381B0869